MPTHVGSLLTVYLVAVIARSVVRDSTIVYDSADRKANNIFLDKISARVQSFIFVIQLSENRATGITKKQRKKKERKKESYCLGK